MTTAGPRRSFQHLARPTAARMLANLSGPGALLAQLAAMPELLDVDPFGKVPTLPDASPTPAPSISDPDVAPDVAPDVSSDRLRRSGQREPRPATAYSYLGRSGSRSRQFGSTGPRSLRELAEKFRPTGKTDAARPRPASPTDTISLAAALQCVDPRNVETSTTRSSTEYAGASSPGAPRRQLEQLTEALLASPVPSMKEGNILGGGASVGGSSGASARIDRPSSNPAASGARNPSNAAPLPNSSGQPELKVSASEAAGSTASLSLLQTETALTRMAELTRTLMERTPQSNPPETLHQPMSFAEPPNETASPRHPAPGSRRSASSRRADPGNAGPQVPDFGAPTSVPSNPVETEDAFDGEALADLINDVLVEEARRRGVDLS